MSISLVLTFASIHSSALLSLICQLPSLIYENVSKKSIVIIWSVSSLSIDSILSIVLTGLTISKWSDFHWNIFPCVCSFYNWSLVFCGILFDRMLWHAAFGRLFCVDLLVVICKNVFIYFVASSNFSSFGIKLKSLIKFSLSSFHRNVSPRASSILYHFFGRSSNVEGNRCGHIRSSL